MVPPGLEPILGTGQELRIAIQEMRGVQERYPPPYGDGMPDYRNLMGPIGAPSNLKKGPVRPQGGPKLVTDETQIGPWTQYKPLLKWAHGLHTRAS